MTKEEYNKNRPTIACTLCGREITTACYKRHYEACSNPNSKMNIELSGLDSTYRLDHDDLFCKFCGEEYKSKNALCQHELRCKLNPNRKKYDSFSNYIREHRKGKTKDNCDEIRRQSDTLRKSYREGKVDLSRINLFGGDITYLHEDANTEEIKKWYKHILHVVDNISVPLYSTTLSKGGYKLVKGLQIDKSIEMEHRLIANIYLDNMLSDENVVHHIDNDKSNNDIMNLLVFKTLADHARFHTSSRAMLKYDDTTHLFTCVLV